MKGKLHETDVGATFRRDVIEGLSSEQKTLPCKYLYDERGAELFERICELEEYYVTRAELLIMEQFAPSIAACLGEKLTLVEFGSGSSLKTRVLLDSLVSPSAYVPIDISGEALQATAASLRGSYPDVRITPLVADFTKSVDLSKCGELGSRVALYFPGSTIGNFESDAAARLLRSMSSLIDSGEGLLIGIDLQKDVSIIEAAYNDAAGVTAEFNLNLLRRINSELDADFDLSAFAHKAVYDSRHHRMVLSLVSAKRQSTWVGGDQFNFDQGEEILTEYSHKYTVEGFGTLAAGCGFTLSQQWIDEQGLFGVLYLVKVVEAG